MTPEQLRASILQMAVQGKLVEQRPEEGTAGELYKQIQQEKEKLIKEKKIKKGKHLDAITEDEIPFDIPESWKWVRLRNICTKIVDGDHNPPSGVSKQTEYLMLSATNINNDTLSDLSKVRYLTKEIYEKEDERTKVEVGDIFFTIVGTLGRSCVYEGGYNICFQRSVSVLSTLIYNKFLKYALDSAFIQNYMIIKATGTAQKGFYLNQVENLLIPLPPLEEQHRIVAKIEQLLPYVDRYAASYEKLEQFNAKFPEDMKKSILQYAIQGKLVEQRPEEGTAEELYQQIQKEKKQLIKDGKIKKGKNLPAISEDEIPCDIPENWMWVRLNDIIFNHGQKKPETTFSYIDIGSIDNKNQKLNKEENFIKADDAPSRARKIIEYGDIIYSTVRPYLHNTCIIDKEFAKEPIASTGFAVMSCFSGLYNKYLFYYLLSPAFDNYANATENAKGVAYPAINDDKLSRSVVPLPPLEEQHRIVAKIEQLLPYCDRLIK